MIYYFLPPFTTAHAPVPRDGARWHRPDSPWHHLVGVQIQPEPTLILRQQPGFVAGSAGQVYRWAKGESNDQMWQIMYMLGYIGTAPANALDTLVDEDAKRTLCKAFAASISLKGGSPERHGRLGKVASEALGFITAWSKDHTFVHLLLHKKVGLGKAIGVVAETTKAGGTHLVINHAQTIAELCANVCISLMKQDARRDEPPELAEFLANGAFRALLVQCEGPHITDVRVAEPADMVLDFVKMDPSSIRKYLAKGGTSRECLDRAALKCHQGTPVAAQLREIAALADAFDALKENKATAADANAHMCRSCDRPGMEKHGDMTRVIKMHKCSGCRHAYYCSKECQRTDWKQGGHKEECLGTQESFAEDLGPGKRFFIEKLMTSI